MERLDHYRQAVRNLLGAHASVEPALSQPEIESQLLFDSEHDHYQLLDQYFGQFLTGNDKMRVLALFYSS